MQETKLTTEQCIEVIKAFADKHNIQYELEGEVGFGRECVGFLKGENYVDYNPICGPDYEYVLDFYDERLSNITPENAYHKHDCLAVLGRGEQSIQQLAEWVVKLEELGVEIAQYRTGYTGIQAMISGVYGNAVRIKK